MYCDRVSHDPYLIEGTLLPLKIREACSTHCVTTSKRYRTALCSVKVMTADWTGEKFRPLRCLYWHSKIGRVYVKRMIREPRIQNDR